MKYAPALALSLLLLSGCFEQERASAPPPITMTADSLGFYCQMTLIEHPGPKGQIHLAGQEHPIFFSQVRDAIAFERMPEQSGSIAAIYVNDMGAAKSWEEPGADNWIPASEAFFVAGSQAVGGMGAPELVPFSERAAAEAFAARKGGRVLTLAEVADHDVLGPATPLAEGGDDQQYHERLNAVSHGHGG
jgi:copper chaperone NosL